MYKGATMIRTQVYLTESEKQKLTFLIEETGQSQSELIREAIDQFAEQKIKQKKNTIKTLEMAKGLWKDRKDLPDFSKLRKEWDDR